MSLEKRQFGGKEKKVKRKAWRELMQEELVERVAGLAEEDLIQTSMSSYDPIIDKAVKHTKFNLFGARQKGHSAILYGNIYRGVDRLYYENRVELEKMQKANLGLFTHHIGAFGDEVFSELQYFNFPHSKKKNLFLQTWVPKTLAHVAECLAISNAGLYSMSLFYSFYDEDTIPERHREVFLFHVRRFRTDILGRNAKLQALLNYEESDKKIKKVLRCDEDEGRKGEMRVR